MYFIYIYEIFFLDYLLEIKILEGKVDFHYARCFDTSS